MSAREYGRPEFTIAGRPVGPGHPCYVIAEAGSNHNRAWSARRDSARNAHGRRQALGAGRTRPGRWPPWLPVPRPYGVLPGAPVALLAIGCNGAETPALSLSPDALSRTPMPPLEAWDSAVWRSLTSRRHSGLECGARTAEPVSSATSALTLTRADEVGSRTCGLMIHSLMQ